VTALLTFLGTGQYQTITDTWEGRDATPTHLFPHAATKLFTPERVVVFVTPQAREGDHFIALSTTLVDKLKPVDIPMGARNPNCGRSLTRLRVLWQGGQMVILDITHAFRSIPMIVFPIAAFLRKTKGEVIELIVYGAFEARKPLRIPHLT
jgi:CRISPR-associated DxTHG motif protein